MRHTHAIYHKPTKRLDKDVAMLLGLHAGDGYLSNVWGLAIAGKDVGMGRKVFALVEQVVGVEPYFELRKDGCFALKSGKEQARDFFKWYGYPQGKKAGIVEVPDKVMSSKEPRVWVDFLKGAFSSDGSFWFKGKWGQCRFEVSSLRLRDGFINLARRLGFEFRGYSYKHHGGHNKLPLHLAYLGSRDEVVRWMEQVGSISDTHLERYHRWRLRISEE